MDQPFVSSVLSNFLRLDWYILSDSERKQQFS